MTIRKLNPHSESQEIKKIHNLTVMLNNKKLLHFWTPEDKIFKM